MNEFPKNSLDGVRRVRPQTRQTPNQTLPTANPTEVPVQSHLTSSDLEVIDAAVADITEIKPRKKFWSRRRITVGVASICLLVGTGLILSFLLNSKVIVRNTGEGALSLQDNVDPTQLKGEGDGRINILLIGIGGEGHKGGSLSDTIVLASIDPFAKDVALLSIPRDLYLEIPDYGYAKVNAAHAYGEEYGYEGGGPGLLKATLTKALGIPIHYHARIDFDGFKQAIDTVGGVDVDVEQTIDDYSYPDDRLEGYNRFYIEAGRHHLDGETALKYARSRYTTSDFDRSKRQQLILMAFKEKALSLGTLTNPVKITGLIRSIDKNFQTDLQINEIMKLIEIGKEVTNEKVVRANLEASEDNFLAFSNVYGASVLVPKAGDFSEIQRYVRGILVDGYIRREAANVSILNGTDKVGFANKAAEILRSYGYTISKVDNASEQNYTQTVIYDYTNGAKPYTLRYLEQRFGVSAQRRQPEQENQKADIKIILGSDYTPS